MLNIVSHIDLLVLTKLVAMTPLKIAQEDSSQFLFPKVNHTGGDRLIKGHTIAANKLFLASNDFMITVNNLALDNSKAVKSNDNLTDKIMWNLSDRMPLSEREAYLYLYLS